jgi:hypothetical protein
MKTKVSRKGAKFHAKAQSLRKRRKALPRLKDFFAPLRKLCAFA